MSQYTGSALVALSEWIDESNRAEGRDGELLTLHRLIKLSEEVGEVTQALIGATGANPRKGVTGDWRDVKAELLDVAVTALGAFEHLDGHQGNALAELDWKILAVAGRVGVLKRQPYPNE